MAESASIPDGHLDVIFYHGAYPLWIYLKESFGIDITDVCPRVSKEEPNLKTDHGNLVARVVDLDASTTLNSIHNNDLIFLLNSINVVFESLKAGIEKDGLKILQSFKFKLDSNHSMFLVGVDSDVAISNRVISVLDKQS